MPTPSSLSFKINFEGEPLIADLGKTEFLHEAITRTTLANGTNGLAIIEGDA